MSGSNGSAPDFFLGLVAFVLQRFGAGAAGTPSFLTPDPFTVLLLSAGLAGSLPFEFVQQDPARVEAIESLRAGGLASNGRAAGTMPQ